MPEKNSTTGKKKQFDNKQAVELHRRTQVAQLYLQGMSLHVVATKLGVSYSTVWKSLQQLQTEWKERHSRDFDTMKVEELAKIDRIEAEYWAAWHRSLLPAEYEVTRVESAPQREVTKGEDGKPMIAPLAKMATIKSVKEKKVVYRDGNPEWMAGIKWCTEIRLKVIGAFKDGNTTNNNQFIIKWDDYYDRANTPNPVTERIEALKALPSPIRVDQPTPSTNGKHVGPTEETDE